MLFAGILPSIMVSISMLIFSIGEIEIQLNSLLSSYNNTLIKIPIRSLAASPSLLAFLLLIITSITLKIQLYRSVSNLNYSTAAIQYDLLMMILSLVSLTDTSLLLLSSLTFETILTLTSYSTDTFTFVFKLNLPCLFT